MAPGNSHSKDDASRLVLREMRSRENTRFLRRMPAFKIQDTLPDRLSSLLGELERVEGSRRAGGNQAGALGAASGPQRK